MKNRRKWTVEEEKVLTDQIKRNENNLQKAFRKTGVLIDRTAGACCIHWYGVMQKRNSISVVTVRNNTEKPAESWWKRFLFFLKNKR